MPVRRDGRIVAGIAASGSTVSPFIPAGIEPEMMIADGEPANPEDLLIAYALEQPYVGQHGDDRRPLDQRRSAPGPTNRPRDWAWPRRRRPPRQPDLDWARGLADAVIARAATEGLAVSVCVVDRRGEPMQHDAMDDAPTSGAYVAEAVAAAAALFHAPERRPGRADPGRRAPAARPRLRAVRRAARPGDGRVVAASASVDRHPSGAPSSRPPYWRTVR